MLVPLVCGRVVERQDGVPQQIGLNYILHHTTWMLTSMLELSTAIIQKLKITPGSASTKIESKQRLNTYQSR